VLAATACPYSSPAKGAVAGCIPPSASSRRLRSSHHRGLADWYAVVALFKRPLGLPIPAHPRSFQSNQHASPTSSGEFIEVHFLEAAPVEVKAPPGDFGSFIRRLAARPPSAARSGAVCAAAAARGAVGEETRADDLSSPAADLAARLDRSGAACRRHAARFRAGGRHHGLLDDIRAWCINR